MILNELKEEVLRQVGKAPSTWTMSDWLGLDSAARVTLPSF